MFDRPVFGWLPWPPGVSKKFFQAEFSSRENHEKFKITVKHCTPNLEGNKSFNNSKSHFLHTEMC
jgi:hypothetical protein